MRTTLLLVSGLVSLCVMNAGRICLGQSQRLSAAWYISIMLLLLGFVNLLLLIASLYYAFVWIQPVLYALLASELLFMLLLKRLTNS